MPLVLTPNGLPTISHVRPLQNMSGNCTQIPKSFSPKTPEDYRFKPRSVPRVRERPQSESRPRSVKRSTMSQRAKTPEIGRTSKIIEPYNVKYFGFSRKICFQPEVKRNERLYPNGFPDRGGFDDPYDLPDYSG